MNDFLLRCPDPEAKAAFYGKTTWEDVQAEATAAFDKYTQDGHSWRHPFRSAGRAFGSVACRAEFLVELIPDGDYTGLLCGALKLVFNVSART